MYIITVNDFYTVLGRTKMITLRQLHNAHIYTTNTTAEAHLTCLFFEEGPKCIL